MMEASLLQMLPMKPNLDLIWPCMHVKRLVQRDVAQQRAKPDKLNLLVNTMAYHQQEIALPTCMLPVLRDSGMQRSTNIWAAFVTAVVATCRTKHKWQPILHNDCGHPLAQWQACCIWQGISAALCMHLQLLMYIWIVDDMVKTRSSLLLIAQLSQGKKR